MTDVIAPLPRCALCGRRTGNTLYRANVDGKLEKVCSSCYCQLAFEDSEDAE